MMVSVNSIDEAIAPIYAYQIIDGAKTINDVPEFGRVDKTYKLRDKVKELLIEMGYPDLAVES